MRHAVWQLLLVGFILAPAFGEPVVVDMKIGESFEYERKDGVKKTIKVLEIKEARDEFRNAVRFAEVTVDVDGERGVIPVAQYTMPSVINGVKMDAAVTGGYVERSSHDNVWGLEKGIDVRMRFWDPDAPLLEPGTFGYPVKQRWFASDTQMANEPCFVDGGEDPNRKDIYYHYALDFGGYDLLVRVVAATDGEVISVGDDTITNFTEDMKRYIKPRYDVVYLRDKRGWAYRYSHMSAIMPHLKPGTIVKKGDWIGILGKEGASGGWSHLHFGVCDEKGREMNAYPFAVEAYLNEHPNSLLAVARPHRLAKTGEPVQLDGSHSISQGGTIAGYEWNFCDGTESREASPTKTYDEPGVYSEILYVKDDRGQVDADFTVVQVYAAENMMEKLPPSLHVTYYPTLGIKEKQAVFFKVRTFRVKGGKEHWNFGDGTTGETKSQDEYATISHHYEKAGLYIVTVKRTSNNGVTSMARVKVIVEEKK